MTFALHGSATNLPKEEDELAVYKETALTGAVRFRGSPYP
jgi:hypothetical protein